MISSSMIFTLKAENDLLKAQKREQTREFARAIYRYKDVKKSLHEVRNMCKLLIRFAQSVVRVHGQKAAPSIWDLFHVSEIAALGHTWHDPGTGETLQLLKEASAASQLKQAKMGVKPEDDPQDDDAHEERLAELLGKTFHFDDGELKSFIQPKTAAETLQYHVLDHIKCNGETKDMLELEAENEGWDSYKMERFFKAMKSGMVKGPHVAEPFPPLPEGRGFDPLFGVQEGGCDMHPSEIMATYPNPADYFWDKFEIVTLPGRHQQEEEQFPYHYYCVWKLTRERKNELLGLPAAHGAPTPPPNDPPILFLDCWDVLTWVPSLPMNSCVPPMLMLMMSGHTVIVVICSEQMLSTVQHMFSPNLLLTGQ
jgi:hypothetical protein